MTLPSHPHLQRTAGRLGLDGHDLTALARQWGTPLYAYSAPAMRAAATGYLQALQGHPHLLCYAMKANSSLAVLQLFARMGLGFDIVSGGELQRVLAAGGQPQRVVFSGVGKSRADMRLALEAGIKCFNVESLAELDVLSEVAMALGREAPVSLRVNPDVDAGTHPYISTGLKDNKFGIAHHEAVAAYRQAAQRPGLKVVGIDCHIGSQITELSPYLDALHKVLDLVDTLAAEGLEVQHIDVGGGLGITYTDEAPPSAGSLVTAVLDTLKARGHGHRELLMEPGRSLVGNAGVLLTEVLYLKPSTDGGKQFCIVDAAMNDLVRPAMYEAYMGIEACEAHADRPSQRWDVVGPVCESGDWLGRDRQLSVAAGDVLAVLSAGAYGMTMASNYNSRGRAAELLIDTDGVHLIRQRESHADLMRHEQLLP